MHTDPIDLAKARSKVIITAAWIQFRLHYRKNALVSLNKLYDQYFIETIASDCQLSEEGFACVLGQFIPGSGIKLDQDWEATQNVIVWHVAFKEIPWGSL